MLKINMELMMYQSSDPTERQKMTDLLHGHNHAALYDYINKERKINLNRNCARLLNALFTFYGQVRYARYRYNPDNATELKIMRRLGKEIKGDDFDNEIKHLYGKCLGRIARSLYDLLYKLSTELNIFVYELRVFSPANFTLCQSKNENDLYETLKRVELSKKELLWYIMCAKQRNSPSKIEKEFPPLPFAPSLVNDFIAGMIAGTDACGMLYEFVSDEYDRLYEENKENWIERMNFIGTMIGG